MRRIVLQILLAASICAIGQARAIYVDNAIHGPSDGLSWETAYRDLQEALADARSGDKPVVIRVAQGIYKPHEGPLHPPGPGRRPDPREAVFRLPHAVALVGGYAGFGAQFPDLRDVDRYQTILSGDLEGNDAPIAHARDLLTDPTRTDNSFRIVRIDWSAAGLFSPILDGFTISGANGTSALYVGGSRPSIRNCTFVNNTGAIYAYSSAPEITNCIFVRNATKGGGAIWTGVSRSGGASGGVIDGCTFVENYAQGDGGAVYLRGGIGDVKNSIFIRNSAHHGGAIRGWGLNVVNCLFVGNSAAQRGGGFWVGNRAKVENCIFACNRAREGGGVYYGSGGTGLSINLSTFWANEALYGGAVARSSLVSSLQSPVVITNTILRNGGDEIYIAADQAKAHTTVTYSNIEGGWPGEGNIDADPLFAAPGYWDPNGTPDDPSDDFLVEGDYHLKSQAGRWDPISESWVIDEVTSPCIDAGDPYSPLGDEPFPHGGRINMGAYGGTAEASKSWF